MQRHDAFELLLPVLRKKAAKSKILLNGVFIGPNRRFVSDEEAAAIKEGVEYLKKMKIRLIEKNRRDALQLRQPSNGAGQWQPELNKTHQQQTEKEEKHLEEKSPLNQQDFQSNNMTSERDQQQQQQQQQQCRVVNNETKEQAKSRDEAEAQRLVAINAGKKAKLEDAQLRIKELEKQIETQQNDLQQLHKLNDVALKLVLSATVKAVQKYENECRNKDYEQYNCSLLIGLLAFR